MLRNVEVDVDPARVPKRTAMRSPLRRWAAHQIPCLPRAANSPQSVLVKLVIDRVVRAPPAGTALHLMQEHGRDKQTIAVHMEKQSYDANVYHTICQYVR